MVTNQILDLSIQNGTYNKIKVRVMSNKRYALTYIRDTRSFSATAVGVTGVLQGMAWMLAWAGREGYLADPTKVKMHSLERTVQVRLGLHGERMASLQTSLENLLNNGVRYDDSQVRHLLDRMEEERRILFDAEQELRQARREYLIKQAADMLNDLDENNALDMNAAAPELLQDTDLGAHLCLDPESCGAWTWAEMIPMLMERAAAQKISGSYIVSEIRATFSE